MNNNSYAGENKIAAPCSRSARFKSIKEYKVLLLMMLPAVILLAIFNYYPMYGVLLAFKDFSFKKGILGSEWVGLKYFQQAFQDPYFFKTVTNTLLISIYKLFWGFPVPILFALLLNEILNRRFKKIVQTVSYLPYFMSWVVLGGILFSVLSLDGPVNAILKMVGIQPVMFLAESGAFRSVLVVTDIWKGFGYGAIIYLATITSIDQGIYEAASIDGARRFTRIRYITIPYLLPIASILLILSLSGIMDAGFDQVFNLYNKVVYDTGDIIDTYVYRKGLVSMEYSYSTAVGLFKSVIGIILIYGSNKIAKVLGGNESTLW